MRDQRQRTRILPALVEYGVDKPRLEPQTGPSGRLLDGVPHVLTTHRPDEHLVGGDAIGEPRDLRAPAVEVSSHCEHDAKSTVGRISHGAERLDEGRAHTLTVGVREQLLELIDADQPLRPRGVCIVKH